MLFRLICLIGLVTLFFNEKVLGETYSFESILKPVFNYTQERVSLGRQLYSRLDRVECGHKQARSTSLIAKSKALKVQQPAPLAKLKGLELMFDTSLVICPLKKNILIILDPGHGGHDAGTQSISKPRYREKSLNLITAQFVKKFLTQMGYEVLMTRESDTFISLEQRSQFANQTQAALFVSIHYNSAPSSEASGIEVFFYLSKENKQRTAESKQLAQSVLKSVIGHTKSKSRGVKNGNFSVIRETKMPAILIEGGFMTNEADLQLLKDPTYLKRLAWGMARGINDYLSVSKHVRLLT